MRLDDEGRVPRWAALVNLALLVAFSWAVVYWLVRLVLRLVA